MDKESAEKSCSHDSLCKGLYDPDCSNGAFALCFVGPDYIDGTKQCIYDKRGKLLFLFNIFIDPTLKDEIKSKFLCLNFFFVLVTTSGPQNNDNQEMSGLNQKDAN